MEGNSHTPLGFSDVLKIAVIVNLELKLWKTEPSC